MKYSPEPQKIVEEDFTFEDQEVIIIMDSSEEEELDGTHQAPFGHIGYELLPQEAPQVDNADSDSGNSSDAIPQVSTQVNGTSDNVADTVESPMTPECTNRTRPEMEINADEVREAMRNVTLPQSSFPSWVSSIPESELNEFVSTRLARRLNDHQVNGDIPPP